MRRLYRTRFAADRGASGDGTDVAGNGRTNGQGEAEEGRVGVKIFRRWGVLAVLVLMLVASGCAYKNEGAIDYRRQKLSTGSTGGASFKLVKKYAMTEGLQSCPALDEHDKISIHLVQGFVKDFMEIANLRAGETKKTTRGEIAVVVKAAEMTSDGLLNFDAAAVDSGRLIYYNDDVRRGQFLNFSYLPVYGPVEWKGNPIVLQIYIIEVDTDSEQLQPLLKTLATLGSMLYAPAAPALTVLDKLGTALLSGSHDDVLFRYHMTFYPESGGKELGYPVLTAGNYVLMRQEDRQVDFNWDRIEYDREDGRLRVGPGEDAPLFRDETYLVFQVQKDFQFTTNAADAGTYGDFVKNLRAKAAQGSKVLNNAAIEAASELTSNAVYQDIKSLLNRIPKCDQTNTAYTKERITRFIKKLSSELTECERCKKGIRGGCLTEENVGTLVAKTQDLAPGTGITQDMIRTASDNVIKIIVKAQCTGQ